MKIFLLSVWLMKNFFVQKVYKVEKKVQTSSPTTQQRIITILTKMNNSFDSTAEDQVQPRTKLVKTKASAVVAVNERPFKTYKLKLELDQEENEAFGTICFNITPVRTPTCTCPNAPKASRAKLHLRLKNIRTLIFPEDEEYSSSAE